MNVRVRIKRKLLDDVRADLARPHPFAAERVGFLFGRIANLEGDPIVLLTSYSAISDERYINDPYSGARIDSQAIRSAMQSVINQGEGAFHVHMHMWPGKPQFSPMDDAELPRLIPSFQTVGPELAHGLFLMSPDNCSAMIWLPGARTPIEPANISLVGFPLQIF